jgi:hypothetical protein
MYGYDVDTTDTKQSRAFDKLMVRQKPVPTDAQLHTIRFDNHEDCLEFMAKHDFITMVTNLGHGTVELEYMS